MDNQNRRSPSIRGLKMQLEETQEKIDKLLKEHNYTGSQISDLEYQIDIIEELITYKEKYENCSEIAATDKKQTTPLKIIRCKDCANGHFIIPCKAAKTNHELLRYQCKQIKGNHKPDFFCAYAAERKNHEEKPD